MYYNNYNTLVFIIRNDYSLHCKIKRKYWYSSKNTLKCKKYQAQKVESYIILAMKEKKLPVKYSDINITQTINVHGSSSIFVNIPIYSLAVSATFVPISSQYNGPICPIQWRI